MKHRFLITLCLTVACVFAVVGYFSFQYINANDQSPDNTEYMWVINNNFKINNNLKFFCIDCFFYHENYIRFIFGSNASNNKTIELQYAVEDGEFAFHWNIFFFCCNMSKWKQIWTVTFRKWRIGQGAHWSRCEIECSK